MIALTIFLEWFASISALVAAVLTMTLIAANRTHYAVMHYLGQCNIALSEPKFSNPELAKLDLRQLECAGHVESDFEPGGLVYSIVWGRDVSAANAAAFLAAVDADLLVTGHVPTEEGFAAPNDRQLILDSLGTPAGYCLFPTTRPLTHTELVHHAGIL